VVRAAIVERNERNSDSVLKAGSRKSAGKIQASHIINRLMKHINSDKPLIDLLDVRPA
jgi:hypothetical protein